MIKLFSLKNQQQNEANKGSTGGKRASAAQLRVQKGKNLIFLTYILQSEESLLFFAFTLHYSLTAISHFHL